MPSEVRGSTIAELTEVARALGRRRAADADARAWVVAHLMLASGNLRRGTRLGTLLRELLGREPGTVPGQPDASAEAATLSPEQSVAWMAAWVRDHGGHDARPGVA